MKARLIGIILILAGGLGFCFSLIPACDEDKLDPADPDPNEVFEDIRVSSRITPGGGAMELSDENGNKIRLVIPPLALEDTVEVSLTLLGQVDELALESRDIRAFSIAPADLELYYPVEISVVLPKAVEDLRETGLFYKHENSPLLALENHEYAISGDTLRAWASKAGHFAEGRMSEDQLMEHYLELRESMGLSAKGSFSMQEGDYAGQWFDTWSMASAILADMYWLEMTGKYEDMPGRTFESDQDALCNDWICPGVDKVLKMAPPTENPCVRSYVQTIGDMLRAMNRWACDDCEPYSKVNARYQKIMQDCGTYLDVDISYELTTDDGYVSQQHMGPVRLTARYDQYGLVVMEGSGSIPMTGNLEAGDCSGIFSGETQVDVYGFRDSDWNYSLYVTTVSSGAVAGSCPGGAFSYPIEGDEEETELSLNPGNEYIYEETEMSDEGGTMEVFIQLFNPWMGMPD